MRKAKSQIQRDSNGVPRVEARDEAGLYFGQGAAHATDRGMQILLMRLLGQGRVSECLDACDAWLRMDQFFRRANWRAHTQSPDDDRWLAAGRQGEYVVREMPTQPSQRTPGTSEKD